MTPSAAPARDPGASDGFTLVELLVVMVVLGVLAAIAVPAYLGAKREAYEASAKSDVRAITKEVLALQVDGDGAVLDVVGSGGTWEVLRRRHGAGHRCAQQGQRGVGGERRATRTGPSACPSATPRSTRSTGPRTTVACARATARPELPSRPDVRGADPTGVARTDDARRAQQDDAGLTLVEVMVAMVLFVLGSLSLLSVLASSVSGTFDNRARLTATNLAASDIDEVRSLDYFALAPADYTTTVDGRDYRVVREVVVTTATGAATSACVGSGGVKQFYKRVSTRVTTAFRGATTRAVRADTLVDAPLIDPSSTKGALGFTVLNRTSSPHRRT